MIIFAALTVIFVFGIGLMCTSRDENTGMVGVVLAAISGMSLIIGLIALVTNPMEVKGDISKFLAAETTIKKARRINHIRIDELSDIKTIGILTIVTIIENAAIQHKIIESNRWLAKQQYYNSTIFGLWIPDKVDELKPIR